LMGWAAAVVLSMAPRAVMPPWLPGYVEPTAAERAAADAVRQRWIAVRQQPQGTAPRTPSTTPNPTDAKRAGPALAAEVAGSAQNLSAAETLKMLKNLELLCKNGALTPADCQNARLKLLN
jgi:hypothetical protein